MIYIILIFINSTIVEEYPVPTLKACIEITRETNDDGSKKAACLIKSKRN